MSDHAQRSAANHTLEMAPDGRLVIPADLRRAIGAGEGGRFVARVEDGRLVLERYEDRIERVQERVRSVVPPGVSMTAELIAERRREAERE